MPLPLTLARFMPLFFDIALRLRYAMRMAMLL